MCSFNLEMHITQHTQRLKTWYLFFQVQCAPLQVTGTSQKHGNRETQ